MDDAAFRLNASASFEDVERNGAPALPLPFESVSFGSAVRTDEKVYNPFADNVLEVSNIIYERPADGRPPDRAYWVGRKLQKLVVGVVKECTVLLRRDDVDVPWEVTHERAAVKIMSRQRIHEDLLLEGVQKELAAVRYVTQHGPHPHVLGALEFLEDEEYFLLFIPYCSSGNLLCYVQQAGRFPECMARYWFRQILEGVSHLQQMGICHMNLSLDNILVDDLRTCKIVAWRSSLRVPYAAPDEAGAAEGSAGTLRRLIQPVRPDGGTPVLGATPLGFYAAPEIVRGGDGTPFDGFAADLWAVAVALFVMLVGEPPWERAHEDDPSYSARVTQGGGAWARRLADPDKDRPIGPRAADLLERMLRPDPRERLSLQGVKAHEWVTDPDPSVAPQ